MGTLLEKPVTDKQVEHGSTPEFKWVMASMQGWRAEMEDAHICRPMVYGPGKQKYHFFGVFDGHGGKLCAKESAKHLLPRILRNHHSDGGEDASLEAKKISKAMQKTFPEFDRDHLQNLSAVATHTDCSGTTAITAFVLPGHIVVANCGDSRCVLGKSGGTSNNSAVKAIPMSFDHKPKNPQERRRIEEAGGHVSSDRVDGDLAVSRALGDFSYKDPKRNASKQKVSPCPDIKIQPRSPDHDKFLILACDGIWDVMTNQEVVTFVASEQEKGWVDAAKIAESLLDKCLAKGSKDNMSVVIVFFTDNKAKGARKK